MSMANFKRFLWGNFRDILSQKSPQIVSILVLSQGLWSTVSMIVKVWICFFSLFMTLTVWGQDFRTNSLKVINPPQWVKKSKVQKVTDHIESKLEWKIRRIPVYWHQSQATYAKAHNLGPLAAAVTVKSPKQTAIHIGPSVDKSDYQQILGHELVHVVFYQKYRHSIPKWLEEGFANFLSRKTKVDYSKLKKLNLPKDVTQMDHPFSGSYTDIKNHYLISQALVEMLDKKCDLSRLLRLSVNRKLMTYIHNTCQIKDINQSFQTWITNN